MLFAKSAQAQRRLHLHTAFIAAVVCSLSGCVKRFFHETAAPQTLQAFGGERIAISNLGLGWCWYIEDKNYKPTVVKTGIVDREISVDLKTGIERTDKYEIVFSRRKFLRAHEVPFEFSITSEWTKLNHEAYFSSDETFSVFQKLEIELSMALASIYSRRVEQGICEALKKDDAPNLTSVRTIKATDDITEYKLRCENESGELIRRTEYEQLSAKENQILRSILEDFTKRSELKKFHHAGTPCRESILQLESSRGRFLGSEQKKVF
ncbi:MAG: hypothetical protein RI953_1172 [Pseudomonadota bacterium]